MVVKNASTHAEICGRGAGCKGGHNAVEQSSYISREKMYCEYDGKTYYPKYSEDLVHNEVMLPDNAPKEYADPKVLWNSVEMFEKNKNAQLARSYKLNLPNEWSYELAVDVMRDYVKRNFVDVGMCVQFAIHDSENTKGQRNLHCHIMLTLRSIDEQGRWMDKSHKVDILDENGNRIPVIDPKTGKQKVDNQNRKQWKCKSVSTNDWNSKENAMKWRKDIVDTINSVNEKMGIKDIRWEYRSFKNQGLDIEPQIHLGPKASALEREGIRTERGDINRQIIASNSIILQARAAYEQAKSSLETIKSASIDKIKSVKNEIIDVIREMAKRNNNRLKLPIINGQYLRLISNRESYQNKETMEKFVYSMGWTSFEDFKKCKEEYEQKFNDLKSKRENNTNQFVYYRNLLEDYKTYEPYIKYHKEQWALKGFARKKYEKQHRSELLNYDVYRDLIKSKIKGDDKRILPKEWQKQIDKINRGNLDIDNSLQKTVSVLSAIEVLQWNKKDLQRMIENENHKKQKEQSINRNKNEIS